MSNNAANAMSNIAMSNIVDAANATGAATQALGPTGYGQLIGGAAFIAALICFVLFVSASDKHDPDKAVEAAKAKGVLGDLDPNVLASFAKALAEAFSKVGPSVVALIGSILFLMLAGEAWQVWHLVGTSTAAPGQTRKTGNGSGSGTSDNSAAQNDKSENANGTTNAAEKR